MTWFWIAWTALKNAAKWVVNHPKMAAVGALMLTILGFIVRTRWLEGKVDQLETKARGAAVDGKAEKLQAEAAKVDEQIAKATETIAGHESAANTAQMAADGEADVRRKTRLPKQWPTRR